MCVLDAANFTDAVLSGSQFDGTAISIISVHLKVCINDQCLLIEPFLNGYMGDIISREGSDVCPPVSTLMSCRSRHYRG